MAATPMTTSTSGFYVKPIRERLTDTTAIKMLGVNANGEIVANPLITSNEGSTTWLNSGTLVVKGDNTIGQQVLVCGVTDVRKQFLFGFNTTDNYAALESIHQGVGFKNIVINQNGVGRVGIGVVNPGYQLQLSSDSAAKPTSTLWTVGSDIRIKEEIEDANLQICYDVLKNLKLRRFRWKNEYMPDIRDRHSVSFIANELRDIYPKDVIETPKQQFMVETPSNTDEKPEYVELENFLSVDLDQIYKTMYGAIQKLIEKVETLETEYADLRSQNLDLLTRIQALELKSWR